MPSALPKVVLRAEQARIDSWRKAAGDEPLNKWAGRALDSAVVESRPSPQIEREQRADLDSLTEPQVRASVRRSRQRETCPNERHHRPGAFCKACGKTPS